MEGERLQWIRMKKQFFFFFQFKAKIEIQILWSETLLHNKKHSSKFATFLQHDNNRGFGGQCVNFINILCSAFAPIFLCQKISKPKCNLRKLPKALSYKTFARKMLMKLTKG